jgi:hypothetical protein
MDNPWRARIARDPVLSILRRAIRTARCLPQGELGLFVFLTDLQTREIPELSPNNSVWIDCDLASESVRDFFVDLDSTSS